MIKAMNVIVLLNLIIEMSLLEMILMCF